mmetsp:Transcript_7400/g.13266  ORF Transcript_7400/g.13266 Transcript_7400/m.13266 type:complete len:240 (+) Transcript_7400:150-869(+)
MVASCPVCQLIALVQEATQTFVIVLFFTLFFGIVAVVLIIGVILGSCGRGRCRPWVSKGNTRQEILKRHQRLLLLFLHLLSRLHLINHSLASATWCEHLCRFELCVAGLFPNERIAISDVELGNRLCSEFHQGKCRPFGKMGCTIVHDSNKDALFLRQLCQELLHLLCFFFIRSCVKDLVCLNLVIVCENDNVEASVHFCFEFQPVAFEAEFAQIAVLKSSTNNLCTLFGLQHLDGFGH